ncbi:MAG: 2-oxo acid dehydrogenase subunit E2 [Chloroflexi bacterium]|nr:2-oxo acid dehydrogenase subunit E2 [Chloroflexota bacterium]
MAETITMPKLGFDMQEGTLVRWVRSEGENINKGDVLAEIETDKATVEVESSASGVVRKLLVNQGAVVPIGAAIAIVGSPDEKIEDVAPAAKKESKPASASAPSAPAPPTPPQPAAPKPESSAPAAGFVKASPLAKKMARDAKVDLSRIQGSGPGGRIVRKDIETLLAGGAVIASAKAVPAFPIPSVVPVSHEDETVQLTKLRQAIARRMAESKMTAPHFYVSHEYKMDAVMALRKQVNEYLADDAKLSVNDFIIKAAALALRQFPNLNASFAGDKVLRHGAVNVGVAVAVENGLLTVVSKNTDQLPLRQISMDVKRMVAGAREGKVKPEDIQGSTFSISNLGMYDVENFIAILNPPEAAILAVGSAREVPVVEDSEIKVGWRMKATISVDHRVSDGAEAAQFMQTLAIFLEEPLRLLV